MKQKFKEITDWQNKTFPKATPLSMINLLKEEARELETDIESENPAIIYEIIDILFLLFGIVNHLGVSYEDLIKAADEKLQINKMRKWQEPDKDGLVFHIKN